MNHCNCSEVMDAGNIEGVAKVGEMCDLFVLFFPVERIELSRSIKLPLFLPRHNGIVGSKIK